MGATVVGVNMRNLIFRRKTSRAVRVGGWSLRGLVCLPATLWLLIFEFREGHGLRILMLLDVTCNMKRWQMSQVVRMCFQGLADQPLLEGSEEIAPVSPFSAEGTHVLESKQLLPGGAHYTTAMQAIQADCLQPFDLAADNAMNILDDAQYRLLLHRASSRVLSALWAASPACKEFTLGLTRLKLRKPGFEAFRAPTFMDGVPDNTPEEQARVDASAEIHRRSGKSYAQLARQAGRRGAATVTHGVAAPRQHRPAEADVRPFFACCRRSVRLSPP